MKRFFKIFGITLASIVGILLIAIIIICNIIFCPKTLTPLVRNNIDKFISCQVQVDTVDLTFFSTFPNFALNLHNLKMINPMQGAKSDTLANVEHLTASININEFLFKDNIIINEVSLNNTVANLYTDSIGNTNFDVIKMSSDEDEDTTSTEYGLQLHNIAVNNLTASYVDKSLGIDAVIKNLNCDLEGQLQSANGDIDAKLNLEQIRANYNDSINFTADLNNVDLNAVGSLKDNHFDGEVSLNLPNSTIIVDNDTLANKLALGVNVPAEINFDIMHFNLKKALLKVADNQLSLSGVAQLDRDDINMDIDFSTNNWIIQNIISLIPDSYKYLLDGIKAKGIVSFNGKIKGTYNDSVMPIIKANLNYKNGFLDYNVIPYKLHNINLSLSTDLDLNNNSISNAVIHNLSAKTGSMSLSANGDIKDLLGNINFNLHLLGDINLPELKPLIPEDLKIKMIGRTKADIKLKCSLNDITNFDLDSIKANGKIDYSNLDVLYEEMISIKDSKGSLAVNLPSLHKNKDFKELIQASFKGSNLIVKILDGDKEFISSNMTSPDLTVGLGDFRDTTQYYAANCNISFDKLSCKMDTINVNIDHPNLYVNLYPTAKNKMDPSLNVSYSNNSIKANLGSAFNINTQKLSFNGSSSYNREKEDILSRLNPTLNVDFNDGNILISNFAAPIKIPAIKFKFRPNNFDIERSHIIIKNSDFGLSGNITNLEDFINDEGLLTGNLNFKSKKTDVDQIMELINGMGSDDNDEENVDENISVDEQSDSTKEANPFMVPKKINFAFNTNIEEALFAGNKINNVGGKLTIKDGVAILEQMGFTTDAAEMQLTGMYRSDRRNHLFCGLDFHLLNIDIKELINMIPSVDTIVPMLKTFEGKAEFHIAAETYLKANYEPKLSTLRAAAAIEGKDLVLLDNETFSTISKYMLFNKKTKNIVDSLSVEMTVFRDEVDIYPFAISMDKWQAILSGRHNLDMSFDYHISLTKCPLPIRLGLEIKGNLDKLKFRLVPCKYKSLYKPEKQKVTDKRTLALKKMISDSLKDNVK